MTSASISVGGADANDYEGILKDYITYIQSTVTENRINEYNLKKIREIPINFLKDFVNTFHADNNQSQAITDYDLMLLYEYYYNPIQDKDKLNLTAFDKRAKEHNINDKYLKYYSYYPTLINKFNRNKEIFQDFDIVKGNKTIWHEKNNKPIIAILITGRDHNGAFDAPFEVADFILQNEKKGSLYNVIIFQGYNTIKDYENLLKIAAHRYGGLKDLILMGHGNAWGIDVANEEDFVKNKETRSFFKTVSDLMRETPETLKHKIVLAGCSTNSLPITDNECTMNFTEYVSQITSKEGEKKKIKVEGNIEGSSSNGQRIYMNDENEMIYEDFEQINNVAAADNNPFRECNYDKDGKITCECETKTTEPDSKKVCTIALIHYSTSKAQIDAIRDAILNNNDEYKIRNSDWSSSISEAIIFKCELLKRINNKGGEFKLSNEHLKKFNTLIFSDLVILSQELSAEGKTINEVIETIQYTIYNIKKFYGDLNIDDINNIDESLKDKAKLLEDSLKKGVPDIFKNYDVSNTSDIAKASEIFQEKYNYKLFRLSLKLLSTPNLDRNQYFINFYDEITSDLKNLMKRLKDNISKDNIDNIRHNVLNKTIITLWGVYEILNPNKKMDEPKKDFNRFMEHIKINKDVSSNEAYFDWLNNIVKDLFGNDKDKGVTYSIFEKYGL